MATNVYQMVTDRIVEQMAKGQIPWQRPWAGSGDPLQVAISYTSRRPYSLLNQFLLDRPGEWLTWNQIQALKGSVKKGAKSRFVVFYTQIEIEEIGEDGEKKVKRVPILKWYKVFHLDDTTGIESKIKEVKAVEGLEPIEEAEKVVNEYVAREGLKFQNNIESGSAYYSPSEDKVVVPMISQYEIVEEYYSTTFHELTHSTMKEGRCDRMADRKNAAFGGDDYSREELVAEIGSAMICNRIGIEAEKAFKNSVAYIRSWIGALKNDPHMIVWASSRAEKAAKYIMNIND